MDEYIAIIKMFAGNFAPRGFMLCQGQILSISTNTALFSLLGTTYGGNGQTTFGLPDLRGRVPVGTGQGPGLAPVNAGDISGTTTVTLLTQNMPAHTHPATAAISIPAIADDGNTNVPGTTSILASGPSNVTIYSNNPPDTTLTPFPANVTVGIAGGSQPFSIMQPYLGMNYIICTQGLFPPRN